MTIFELLATSATTGCDVSISAVNHGQSINLRLRRDDYTTDMRIDADMIYAEHINAVGCAFNHMLDEIEEYKKQSHGS